MSGQFVQGGRGSKNPIILHHTYFMDHHLVVFSTSRPIPAAYSPHFEMDGMLRCYLSARLYLRIHENVARL